MRRRVRVILEGSSRGFTLAELLISIGIMGLAMGLIGSGIFQALGLERSWSDDVVATREVRHAGSWFAGDALNTQQTDLVDGAAPMSSIILTWTDQDSVSHGASYYLVGQRLVRNYDGDEITVARKVLYAGFSRSGRTLKFTLTVEAAQGETETKNLEVYGRMLR